MGEVTSHERAPSEEIANPMHLRISIFHALVVDAEAFLQFLVIASELFLFQSPIIPKDGDPSARRENTSKFAAPGDRIKPMKRLASSHKIRATVRQSRGFRGAIHAGEAGIRLQILFATLPHLLVWFDTEHRGSLFQHQLPHPPPSPSN